MDAPWRIEMLGRLRAVQPERTITRFRSQKTGALLAYLALHPRRSHPREALIDLLWPDDAPEAGRLSLRVALSSLRRQLEPPGTPAGSVLLADHRNVRLNPQTVTTDVIEFESAVRAAARPADPAARAEILSRAVALYAGELLPGLYEDWIRDERERLGQLYLGALRQLAAAQEEAGDRGEAVDAARRAVREDRLDEQAHHELIRLLADSGQVEAALRQYEELERILEEELGETPSPALLTLAQQLRAAPPSPPPPLAPAPPLPPAPLPTPRLPLQLTRFFGREQERARLGKILQEDARRLVTLTGPGGSGKTRLAIEVARDAAPFFGGAVWFVPLADLTEARLLADAIASALRPPGAPRADPLEQAAEALSRQPALLLLDNFEQLAEEGATVVRILLERAPGLTCLVTSRQALDLAAEREFPVLPLPTPGQEAPTPERLMTVSSVQLFTDRAQAVRPDFQVTPGNAGAVASLCRRLEGIPLAIELAAAWSRTLTPAQMGQRLAQRFELLVSRRKDVSERHQTLRAAMAWSLDLLSPELRRFFAALSVFRGGWSAEAAEAICRESSALEWLELLRERSLIVAEEFGDGYPDGVMRLRMLETLRDFAAEQLDVEEAATLRQRHLDWFLELAERAEPELLGPEQMRWLDRLEAEHDNLRAALAWAGRSAARLRLASALWQFWYMRGFFAEGRSWLEGALSRGGGAPETLLAKALNRAGNLARPQGDYAAAQRFYEESLAIYRRLGDRSGIAKLLNNQGIVAKDQGDYDLANARYQESLALYRELCHPDHIADVSGNIAIIALARGDYAAARALFEETLTVQRQRGDHWGVAMALHNLGETACGQGDDAAARAFLKESLRIQRGLREWSCTVLSLSYLGRLAKREGDSHRAARLLGAAESTREKTCGPIADSEQAEQDRHVAEIRNAMGGAAFGAAWSEGAAMTLDQAIEYAIGETDA